MSKKPKFSGSIYAILKALDYKTMRTILIGGTGFTLLALAAFSFTPLSANIASVIGASDRLSTACIEQITTEGDTSSKSAYTIEKADLNDDGADDRIITFTDEASCGTNGCIHEVCLSQGSAVTRIPFGYAATSLTVLSSKTNNMYDLTLNDSITLSWDGERYALSE